MAADVKRDEDIPGFEEIGTHPAANATQSLSATFLMGSAASEGSAVALSEESLGATAGADSRVRILTPHDPAQSCGLANFSVDGVDPGKLGAHLWDRYRIVVTPIVHEEFSGIRVTPNGTPRLMR
jgi:selenocysteine lyase/cysteine desulfurase